MIPCKQCPVFAICYNLEIIRCKILYKYICKISGGAHSGVKRDHIKEVYTLYNKYVNATTFQGYCIFISHTPREAVTASGRTSYYDF